MTSDSRTLTDYARAALDGDAGAAEHLARELGQHLDRYLRFIGVKNHADVQDMVQEVFVRIFNHRYNPDVGPIETWARIVALRLVIDVNRRATRRGERHPDSMDDITSSDPLPADLAYAAERTEEINRCFSQLKADDRVILGLRFRTFKNSEIATILNRNVGSVKAQASRAMNQLKECLGLDR